MSELKKFLIINKVEGYSYLILLFLAMPLKYIMGYPVATKIAGMIHGILFIIFVYQLLEARSEEGFGKKETLWYFILSLVPFGSFYTDRLLKSRYAPALQRVKTS
jgi:integral membrane protein